MHQHGTVGTSCGHLDALHLDAPVIIFNPFVQLLLQIRCQVT